MPFAVVINLMYKRSVGVVESVVRECSKVADEREQTWRRPCHLRGIVPLVQSEVNHFEVGTWTGLDVSLQG